MGRNNRTRGIPQNINNLHRIIGLGLSSSGTKNQRFLYLVSELDRFDDPWYMFDEPLYVKPSLVKAFYSINPSGPEIEKAYELLAILNQQVLEGEFKLDLTVIETNRSWGHGHTRKDVYLIAVPMTEHEILLRELQKETNETVDRRHTGPEEAGSVELDLG